MSDSRTTSPSKNLDIFGKELGLTDAERHALSSEVGEIFLRKVLQVDTHSKKGDPTEPRILVISSSRCYVLTPGSVTKLETHFNFLRISNLQCTESKLIFLIAGETKPREFHSKRKDSVEIIGLITAQLKSVFPVTPLELILKLTFDPDSLRSEVSSLRDSLTSAMNRVDPSSIQGFITSYGFLCDFFGVPFNNEVAWYMRHVYLSHGLRDLNMSDMNLLSPREILPVLSTMRHNEFFEGIIDKTGKIGAELFDELSYVVNVSRAIKQLVLNNSSLKPENLIRLSTALKNNPKTVLTHLDLSENALDDKTVEALGSAIESLPHGLQMIKLVNCKITPRGGSLLAQSMKQNKNMQFSLVHLDLSSNPLGPDPQGSLTFIQDPQTIATLNLSKCNLNFEFVLPVLNRGCQQHLRDLDLSHNFGKGKKGIHGPNMAHNFQQFLSTAISIHTINISGCKLTSDIMTAILEGLGVNPNVSAVDLDVSSNDLGVGKDPQNMAKVLARTPNLYKLNFSECGLDHILPDVIDAVANNQKLKHLFIGRNFGGKNNVRNAALIRLAKLLNKEDCHLKSLCVTDSKLKEQTVALLEALEDNTSLIKLDISGNQMSNRGARSLAKTLYTNCYLNEVRWDNNDTTVHGFREVANALENNYTLRVMPLPLHDIGRAGKGVEEPVQKIQLLLCRNHSDERLKVELAAMHRGRLLTATQQSSVVSRELVQLEDLLQWAEGMHGSENEHVAEALEIKKQANKVVQLTDGLYSPQVESEQLEAITAQVKDLLDSFMDKIFTEHVQDTSEHMVTRSVKASSALLSEEAKKTLHGFVISKSGGDFVQVKKAVNKRTAPEIANHVSAINLDVAANISELVVEQTLLKLERVIHKLLKLKKESQGSSQTPDTKVSRNFTFKVQADESPKKKKKRVRKPDPDEADEAIELPSTPLDTDGPALEHLGKSRPKPARMQRSTRRGGGPPPSKPSALAAAAIAETVPEDKPILEAKPKPKEKKAVEPILPPKPKPKEEAPKEVATQEEAAPPPLMPKELKEPKEPKEPKEKQEKEEPQPIEEVDSKPPETGEVEETKPEVVQVPQEEPKLEPEKKEVVEEKAEEKPEALEKDKEDTKEPEKEEPPKQESPELAVTGVSPLDQVVAELAGKPVSSEESKSPLEDKGPEPVVVSTPEQTPTPEPTKTPTPELVKKPSPELARAETETPEPPKAPDTKAEEKATEEAIDTLDAEIKGLEFEFDDELAKIEALQKEMEVLVDDGESKEEPKKEEPPPEPKSAEDQTPEPAKVPTPEPSPELAKKETPEPAKKPIPEPTPEPAKVPTPGPSPELEKKPTPEPTQVTSPEPDKTPTPEPAKKPTPKPAKKPTPEPAKKPTPEPTKTPTPEPAKKPTPELAKKPTSEPAKTPTPELAKKPAPEPAHVTSPEPDKTPTPEPAKKPTPKPAKKTIPEPTKTPTPEPAKKPTPEPTKTPTPEPAKKPTPEPAKKPAPEPAKKPAPKPAKKPVAKPSKVPPPEPKKDEKPSENGVADDAEKKQEEAVKASPKPAPRPVPKPRGSQPTIKAEPLQTAPEEPSLEERKLSTPNKELSENPGGRSGTPEQTTPKKDGQKHDRKKGTLSKLFNRKSEKSKSPAPEELKPSAEKERIKSGDWEVVEPPKPEASPSPEVIKKPPPVVSQKPKPRRVQSLDEGEEPRRKPVMHTSAPMSELANVLKQGVALKPSKPAQPQDSPTAPRRGSNDPAPAPKPRPKPRPPTKKAASAGDLLESPHRSPHHSPQQTAKLHATKNEEDKLDTLV